MEIELRDMVIRLQTQLEERDKLLQNSFSNLANQNSEIKTEVKKINDVQVSLAVFKAEYRKDLNTVKIFAAIVGTVITIFANFGMKLWKPV